MVCSDNSGFAIATQSSQENPTNNPKLWYENGLEIFLRGSICTSRYHIVNSKRIKSALMEALVVSTRGGKFT